MKGYIVRNNETKKYMKRLRGSTFTGTDDVTEAHVFKTKTSAKISHAWSDISDMSLLEVCVTITVIGKVM